VREIETARIVDLSQDGRGIARRERNGSKVKKVSSSNSGKRPRTRLGRIAAEKNTRTPTAGKTCFIRGALPGELVRWQLTHSRGSYDEGEVVEVIEPSAERVSPQCEHFSTCGGCELQHLTTASQTNAKEQHLKALIQRAGIQAPNWLPPLIGDSWGYRRRARLHISLAKGAPQFGFHQYSSNEIVEVDACDILDPRLSSEIVSLRDCLQGEKALLKRYRLTEIELVAGDDDCAVCLICKNDVNQMGDDPLMTSWMEWCRQRNWQLWVAQEQQPAQCLSGKAGLYTELEGDLNIRFHPGQFVQVNAAANRQMVHQALELLEIEPEHNVLDLFAGAGNFSLPMAKRARYVCGVEGAEQLCLQGDENARDNGIENVDFRVADLTKPDVLKQFLVKGQRFQRILIDPPRSGAADLMPSLAALGADKVLYISCHPAALVRDAQVLLASGYKMVNTRVIDMFPHTQHLEAMALFELYPQPS